ncbi:MAG TPA: RHS repeat-associated core domain-containing protein, partial [Actinomycetota bacterium]|nr:RHS repeat-associated core domain-containing protein [Actinomycetota bacterium]
KVIEPFNGTRSITTRYEYNGVGNLSRLITPRAHDTGLDSLTTKYQYDTVDQLTRIDLPYKVGEAQAAIYRRYDKKGNVIATTAPIPNQGTFTDEALLWQAIPPKMTTTVDYYDTGLPRTIDDHVNGLVTYDYNARGQQTRREVDGQKAEVWEYYDDGMLFRHYDRERANVEYTYDENDNLKKAVDSTGVEGLNEQRVSILVTYDQVDRVAKVRHRKELSSTEPYEFTSYDYDLNGNVVERKENGKESSDGTTIITPPKRHTFTYDQANWLQTQHDYLSTGCQKIENQFNAIGLESVRKVFKAPQGCDDTSATFTVKQSTVWDYYKNRALKTLRTVNGNVDNTSAHNPVSPAVVIERHDLGYLDGTVYMNGHKTTDDFFRSRPNGATCATTCNAKYYYDERDRLTKEDRGYAGGITEYKLNTAGSVTQEIAGGITTDYFYEGLQLDYAQAGSAISNSIYDAEGRLDCVVNANTITSCPAAADKYLKDYSWDDLGRLKQVESFTPVSATTTTKTDNVIYTYDALDRVVSQVEKHGLNATTRDRTTTFSFQGLTSLVTKESFTGSDADSEHKTYTYDAYNTRISMVDDPTGTGANKTYTYGYDAQGSVSTLLDDSTGTVKATYGYDAYGGKDTGLSAGDDGTGRETDPLNPYRYTGRRLDTGSGTLDMGARRFGPDSQTFLQPDSYQGSLANLGLSMDPLSGNRYSLAAGNPVSFVEVDGHSLAKIGSGGRKHVPPDVDGGSSSDFRAAEETNEIDWNQHLIGNDLKNQPKQITRTGPDPSRSRLDRLGGNVMDALTGRDPADHAEFIRKSAAAANVDAKALWAALEIEGGAAMRWPGKQLWDEAEMMWHRIKPGPNTASIGVGQTRVYVFEQTLKDNPGILKGMENGSWVDLNHDEELAILILAFRMAKAQRNVLAADRSLSYKDAQLHIASAHASGDPWDLDPGYEEAFNKYYERAEDWYCKAEQYSCE